jgi:thiaminase
MSTAPAPLSEELRAVISETAATWRDLPILRGIEDGTLERAIFANYLEQDYLYLQYYARLYSRLAAAATTYEEITHYVTLAHGIVAIELDHHVSAAAPFGCDFDAARPSVQTSEYLAFYDSLADRPAETLVAMLPCIYGYGIALAGIAGGGDYAEWLQIYQRGDYAALIDRHFSMVDASDLDRDRALQLVRTALAHEESFWRQLPQTLKEGSW